MVDIFYIVLLVDSFILKGIWVEVCIIILQFFEWVVVVLEDIVVIFFVQWVSGFFDEEVYIGDEVIIILIIG